MEYVGKGHGKQVLRLLLEYCISLGGLEFYYSALGDNPACRAKFCWQEARKAKIAETEATRAGLLL